METNINKLITELMAIEAFAKDIHYTCHGESFYSKHIFADEIKFRKEIDALKEVSLLGNDIRPLTSKNYYSLASAIIPQPSETDDKRNFKVLQELIKTSLSLINQTKTDDTATNNLIGNIAEKLQKFNGLINLQIED